MMKMLQRLLIASIFLFGNACSAQESNTVSAIPTELTPIQAAAQGENQQWLDVRSQREWNVGHLANAIHLPHSAITADTAAALDRDKTVVTYCAAGVRASRAAAKLRELGYKVTVVVDGGFDDLKAAGLPTTTGRQSP